MERAVLLSDIEFLDGVHESDWERIEEDSFLVNLPTPLNKNQQIVLEWLKSNSNALKVPMLAIYELAGLADEKVRAAYRQLNREEEFQVLAGFAEWGKEEVAE
ncbi:hypothetical protein ABE945_14215 [Enterococcus gilvus]|uniref:hypothetical protein n=1 Tax=Enterococcus gilvus TaxID=160453 RepID=UPI003D6A59D9